MTTRLLACLLLVLPASLYAQTDWIEMASDHFLLYTDTDVEKGQRLLSDLEARHAAFAATFLPLAPRHSGILVLLLSEQEEFQRFLPGAALVDERSAYLFRSFDQPVLIARDRSPDDLIDDVGHSLGHLFLSRSVLWQPFWLQEGVGEYVRRLGEGDTDDAKDSFAIDDLLTIVPSVAYDDLAEGGDFRTQSYHLLRVLLEEHAGSFSTFISDLQMQEGSEAQLDVDPTTLEPKVFGYEEIGLPLDPADIQPAFRALDFEEANRVLGDIARAAGAEALAEDFYRNSASGQSRLGQAVLRKLGSASVWNAFELLVETYPELGWAHYHFGTLQADRAEDRARQIGSLERAVELMPRLGRAYAELGYLHALDGRPADAIPLLERALVLEPEFGDRFFEILAEVWLRLEDYDRSREYIENAERLPHTDPSERERYAVLVPQFYQKIDLYRREREAERVRELRQQVDTLVEDVDPRPVLVPVEPAPLGRVSYSVSSSAGADVVEPPILEAPAPEYAADLRRNGVEGRVVLDVGLDRRGRVVSVEVASADNAELAAASVDALRGWEFQPARQGGASVPYSFRLTVRFYLE